MVQLYLRLCRLESTTRSRTPRFSISSSQILRSLNLRRWPLLFPSNGRKPRPKQSSWESRSCPCRRRTNRFSMQWKSKRLWIWPRKTNTYRCRYPINSNSSIMCCKTKRKLSRSKCSWIELSRKKRKWIWGYCRSCKKETVRGSCSKEFVSSRTFRIPCIRERLPG